MPLIRIRDIKPGFTRTYTTEDFDRKYLVRNNDLLIGMDGEFNLTKWHSGEALMNQRVCRVSSSSEILSDDYLMFFLSSALKQIEERTSFATVKHLSAKVLGSIEVPICSLPEQKAIAKRLITIDDTKTMLARQEGRLIELVKSGFVEMFGDPISNPKGYERAYLRDVAAGKLAYGSGTSAKAFDGSVRYIRITDIAEDGSLNDDAKSPADFDEKYLLSDGDILFARSGATVGKTYRYKVSDGKAIYAGYLIRLVPDQSRVLPDYVYAYTKTDFYGKFVSNAQCAVAQPNINAQKYGSLEILVPPLALQQQFADFVDQVDKLRFKAQAILELVKSLIGYARDTSLHAQSQTICLDRRHTVS